MDFVMNSLLILHKWKVTLENQAQILQMHIQSPQQVGAAAACLFLVLMAGPARLSGLSLGGAFFQQLRLNPQKPHLLVGKDWTPLQIPNLCAPPSLQVTTGRFWRKPASCHVPGPLPQPALPSSPRRTLKQLQPSFSLVDPESLLGSCSLTLRSGVHFAFCPYEDRRQGTECRAYAQRDDFCF